MTVYHENGQVTLLQGDVREQLRTLDTGSVQCCVTSPPYWGLRDYGTATWEGGDPECGHAPSEEQLIRQISARTTLGGGVNTQHAAALGRFACKCGARRIDQQLGLEATPDQYVANMVEVFREVRRVLATDGTLWLNIGDSYAGSWGAQGRTGSMADRSVISARQIDAHPQTVTRTGSIPNGSGLKPKDLVGIPWALAKAMRDPYYAGQIKDERDRIWLAAMLDAEGCMFIHKRKAGQHNGQGYYRQNDNYAPGVEICNTSPAIVERIMRLVGKGSITTQSPEQNDRRKQTIYRWNLRTTESRDFVRELYPYIVAKQHQARILIGCPSSGEKAEAAHGALIGLHRGSTTNVDFPTPLSMYEPGWFLRQEIIWSKSNPMPESVTDRCTKAHESLFLLTKNARYYYDAKAIAELATDDEYRTVGKIRPSLDAHFVADAERGRTKANLSNQVGGRETRNKRSVWTIATAPFAEAHFATFPPALVEPCILAGSKPGDLVLDPFIGSGTTAMVARNLGRRAIGIDLNPEYLAIAERRIGGQIALEAF